MKPKQVINRERFIELYTSGVKMRLIADELGMSRGYVHEYRDKLELKKRKRPSKPKTKKIHKPQGMAALYR